MKKKMVCMLLALAVSLTITACGTGNGQSGESSSGTYSSATESESTDLLTDAQLEAELSGDTGNYFSDGDYKDVSLEEPNATITLSDSTGTISDTTRGTSGETVTITSKGIYRITGSSQNVTILVNDETESGNVYLILDNVNMENEEQPCILVEAADKVILQCVGTNSLIYTSADNKQDGAVYAKDDLTLNGSGALNITSALHGIVCKKDLKLTGLTLSVEADSIGLQSMKTVRIDGAELDIHSGHDGIQISGTSEENYFYMAGGDVKISAGYDGLDVGLDGESGSSDVILAGGTLVLTTGGGSASSKDSNLSQKGVKCDGDVKIGNAELNISSADDAIHASGSVYVQDGTVSLATSDDGIHADELIAIAGGRVSVVKSYEGMEAYEIRISGGDISVTASDDGINAAGGSDSASTEAMPTRWGGEASGVGTLTISGGTLYVNAQGDGLDSNGSLFVSGGTVIVEGPTDNGNGALDKGDGNGCVAQVTGGTILALGTTGMAVNFDSGTQCSGLINLSGEAGTTITVNDGSGFSFTTTKAFQCLVYSSTSMEQGKAYTVTAGDESVEMDFSSGLYYSNVSSMGGGPGGMGEDQRGLGGGPGER